jgi:hypothetical protein
VAVEHLDTRLLGAQRSTAAAGELIEGRTPRLVGTDATVDQPIHELLVEPGDAGDRANLGVDLGAVLHRAGVVGGRRSGRTVSIDVCLGHVASCANGCAGIGRRRDDLLYLSVAGEHPRPVAGAENNFVPPTQNTATRCPRMP